jgi:hypothetical protein
MKTVRFDAVQDPFLDPPPCNPNRVALRCDRRAIAMCPSRTTVISAHRFASSSFGAICPFNLAHRQPVVEVTPPRDLLLLPVMVTLDNSPLTWRHHHRRTTTLPSPCRTICTFIVLYHHCLTLLQRPHHHWAKPHVRGHTVMTDPMGREDLSIPINNGQGS